MEGEVQECGEKEPREGNCSSRLRIRATKTLAAKGDEGGKKSRGHKRKAEVNVEKLYLQENLKEVVSTPLETIFESPRPQKKKGRSFTESGEQKPEWDTETVDIMAARKVKRICNFPSLHSPPKLKTKQRKDRAKRMKQLTGVRVPRGSGSLEEVMAALACLSDEEQQIENNQNINNRSFSALPSSEFYSGNILQPDTSQATMDYVIHNMNTLNVALPDTITTDGNMGIRDMVIPQELLLEDLLLFDDKPSGQKKVTRDKRVRRRSGRVTASLPGIIGLSYTSEEQPSLINNSFEDFLDPGDMPWEPNSSSQDKKLKRRSGRVTVCRKKGGRLSPTSEEPTAHSGSVLEKNNTSCDDPPLSCFPETLLVCSEVVPVLTTQNTDFCNPTGSTLKPVKKRGTIQKTKETSEDSSLKEVPRVLAKEKAKQRKPMLDISKIAKKAQKLDLGQKRGNSAKTENATVKKPKNSRVATVEKSESEMLRGLKPELNPILDKKVRSNNSQNAVLHSSLLMCAGEGFSSPAERGKSNLGCEISSTRKKGRGPTRSKRRVSGVKRPLYRITKTEEETSDSSPNVHKDELSTEMDTPSPSITSPECTERCPITPDTLLHPVNLKNASNDQSASDSFSLKDSGITLWQNPFTAKNVACAMKVDNQVSATKAIHCDDSSLPAGQSSSSYLTASNTIPYSSSISYSTSLSPQISTSTCLSYTTTTPTTSFCHVTTDGITAICSPTSPSEKLAALSLHTDLFPTPTKSSFVQKAKNKSRRRSTRISLDRLKLNREEENSHFGSFWADSPSERFNLGHINPKTADNNAANSIAATLRNVSKSSVQSVTESESVIKKCPVIAQATQKATTCKSEEPKQKRRGRPPRNGVSRVKSGVKTKLRESDKIKNHSSPSLSNITEDHLNIMSAAATVVPGKEEGKESFPLQSIQTFSPPSNIIPV